MICIYENLKHKSEFIKCLASYTLSIFKAGDINRIKDLLTKYNFLNGSFKGDNFQVNEEETVENILFSLDFETQKQNGMNID